ncbi:hypothetical protein AGDE_02095 [Angomonas deanei]|nr:hypothetical protein AGDE_07329 [Angomonas deanei]EPY41828.1 hypothetical protein AGDE_02095 [Angomonas deanei]|eukprot:EPY35455.1 hypothetical protein AGDE_07329 [Angomonas deanei]
MSALVPSEAVTLLYRRYLKAANSIPNVTIRMLLLQQIRAGFERNKGITSPSAQRELVNQAHKDLQVLEDDRLSRTLYINRLGMVSCLDWEVRRTEYNFSPESQVAIGILLFIGFSCVFFLCWKTKSIEQQRPDIAEMVNFMALRLEADSAEELTALRENQIRNMLESKKRQSELENRVLSTFYQAPKVDLPAPTLRGTSALAR